MGFPVVYVEGPSIGNAVDVVFGPLDDEALDRLVKDAMPLIDEFFDVLIGEGTNEIKGTMAASGS